MQEITSIDHTKEHRYNDLYMDIARRCAEMSYANRLKVGAIIVSEGRILSMGWNGMPAGMGNNCETEDGTTNPFVQHAEENAIIKLAKHGDAARGATLYVTHAPCVQCAKLAYGAGISKLIYGEEYRNPDGLYFLMKTNVRVQSIGFLKEETELQSRYEKHGA